jgi:hypothetical protein
MFNFNNLLARALLAFTLAAGAGAAVAGPTYHVDVNTAALGGASGYLDFLIVGQGDTATTTATLSHVMGNFSGDVYTDNTSGSVAAGATLGSSASWNEFALWAGFGGTFSFDVSFDQAIDDIAGALLQIALLDSNFGYLAPTTGDIAQFSLAPGQPIGLTPSAFATISLLPDVSDVPEPSDWMMMATGLALLGFSLRRRVR